MYRLAPTPPTWSQTAEEEDGAAFDDRERKSDVSGGADVGTSE
jgi:hypothetical protein